MQLQIAFLHAFAVKDSTALARPGPPPLCRHLTQFRLLAICYIFIGRATYDTPLTPSALRPQPELAARTPPPPDPATMYRMTKDEEAQGFNEQIVNFLKPLVDILDLSSFNEEQAAEVAIVFWTLAAKNPFVTEVDIRETLRANIDRMSQEDIESGNPAHRNTVEGFQKALDQRENTVNLAMRTACKAKQLILLSLTEQKAEAAKKVPVGTQGETRRGKQGNGKYQNTSKA